MLATTIMEITSTVRIRPSTISIRSKIIPLQVSIALLQGYSSQQGGLRPMVTMRPAGSHRSRHFWKILIYIVKIQVATTGCKTTTIISGDHNSGKLILQLGEVSGSRLSISSQRILWGRPLIPGKQIPTSITQVEWQPTHGSRTTSSGWVFLHQRTSISITIRLRITCTGRRWTGKEVNSKHKISGSKMELIMDSGGIRTIIINGTTIRERIITNGTHNRTQPLIIGLWTTTIINGVLRIPPLISEVIIQWMVEVVITGCKTIPIISGDLWILRSISEATQLLLLSMGLIPIPITLIPHSDPFGMQITMGLWLTSTQQVGWT